MKIIASFNSSTHDLLSQREEGFSPTRYFLIALVAASLVKPLLLLCLPAAVTCLVVSSWHLSCVVIILARRIVEKDSFLERPVCRLYAFAMEINAIIAAAFLFPATYLSCYLAPQGEAKGRPILLVNGYLSFGSTWHYQRQKLIQAGFGPIYTINVGSGRSIKEYAKQVQKKAEEIKRETKKSELVLIAHSKGGLVSSYFATHLALQSEIQVTDVIAIATPFAGTPVARIGPGIDAKEMRTDALFHIELRQKMSAPSSTRLHLIASTEDGIVPSESTFSVTGISKIVFDDLNHLGLLFSSRVAGAICHLVGSDS